MEERRARESKGKEAETMKRQWLLLGFLLPFASILLSLALPCLPLLLLAVHSFSFCFPCVPLPFFLSPSLEQEQRKQAGAKEKQGKQAEARGSKVRQGKQKQG